MRIIDLNRSWTFRRGYLDSVGMLENDPGIEVNLPHDGMIGTPVSPDAPAGVDMGYFTGGLSNYTKYVLFPKEWEEECVGLKFDGAMMNASVDVTGKENLLMIHHSMAAHMEFFSQNSPVCSTYSLSSGSRS